MQRNFEATLHSVRKAIAALDEVTEIEVSEGLKLDAITGSLLRFRDNMCVDEAHRLVSDYLPKDVPMPMPLRSLVAEGLKHG